MSSMGAAATQTRRHSESQLAILSNVMSRVLPTVEGMRLKKVVKLVYDTAGFPPQERLTLSQWVNPRTTIGELYRRHSTMHPSAMASAIRQLAIAASSTPTVMQTTMSNQAATATANAFDQDTADAKAAKINWSYPERLEVAKRFIEIEKLRPTLATVGVMLESQKVLPLERQRHNPTYNTIKGEVEFLKHEYAGGASSANEPNLEERPTRERSGGATIASLHVAVAELTAMVKLLVDQNKVLSAQIEVIHASLKADTTMLHDAPEVDTHFAVLCDDDIIPLARSYFAEASSSISFTISSQIETVTNRVREHVDCKFQQLFVFNSDESTEWVLPLELKLMRPRFSKTTAELKSDVEECLDAED